MKTIKQIADEIGVSKQAVFYRIKRPPLSNALQSFTSKLDGSLMVSFDGEKIIKQAFEESTVKKTTIKIPSKTGIFDDKEPSKFDGSFDGYHYKEAPKNNDEEILFLREQVKELQGELKAERIHSREQSKRLADLAEQLAELNRNNQILLGSEQTRNSQTSQSFLDDGEEVTSVDNSIKNQGFFSKLFRKNKRIL